MSNDTGSQKPTKLFKYQKIDKYTLENLINNIIYFKKPIEFDDPYDCALRIIQDDVTDDEAMKLYQKWKEDEELLSLGWLANSKKYETNGYPNDKFKQAMRDGAKKVETDFRNELLNNRGIACFSSKNDDLLMWSLYTEGHTGICLEYDTSFEPFTQGLWKVDYSDKIPSIRIAKIIEEMDELIKGRLGVDKEYANLPLIMYRTKGRSWEYQNEWRVLRRVYGKFILEEKCLTGVYFGVKMKSEDKDTIIKIIGKKPIECYEMKKK